jgi:uncharacterized membrane protein
MFGIPLHKLIIHFPIALTIIATIYDFWGVYANDAKLHRTGHGLSLWAAAGSLAAVVTGLQLAGVTRLDTGAATGHAGFGIMSCTLLTTLGILRYSAHARQDHKFRTAWLVMEIGAAGLILATAVTGHKL